MVCASMVVATGCSNKQAPADDNVTSVGVIKATADSRAAEKDYMGVVEEEDGANVTFSVLGTVVKVMANEGQFVRKGQPLAEVDGHNIRQTFEMAKATLDQAEDAYRRLKSLYEKGTLPEIRMVEVESNLQRARSSYAMAKKSLDDIVLRAPWSGYVARSMIDVGANITPGVNGIHLVKIERVKVRVPIPEKEVADVAVGQTIAFSVPALGERQFSGRIITKSVTANTISHSYDVRALVGNADHALLPGMVANVRIPSKRGNFGVVVPQQAVLISGTEHYVWVVKGNKVERRLVTVGNISNYGVVVESGLSQDERVVVQGQNKVSEGSVVRVTEIKQ